MTEWTQIAARVTSPVGSPIDGVRDALPVRPLQPGLRFPAGRGSGARHSELAEGLERGDRHQVLLGVTGSGKTFTMAQTIARVNRPTLVMVHNKTLAAQLYPGIPPLFSRERRRVLRQLLRLLPARSLHPGDRHVHRERSDDQRRDRPHAPVGHAVALRAPRRDHRRQRVVHLRPGFARGVLRHAAAARARPDDRPRGDPAQARRDPVRAQRSRFRARHVPRARRHRRNLSRRTKNRACASSSSATRSTSSRRSIR